MSRVEHHPKMALAVWFFLIAGPANGAELKQTTVEAFVRYVRLTETRIEKELETENSFLWVDGWPADGRRAYYARLRQGQIVIEEMKTLENGQPIKIPNGLIHHRLGVVFIPGVTLEQTVALVTDYENYQNVYKPDISRSKILRRDGNLTKIYLRLYKKKVVVAVINTEHDVYHIPIDRGRAHSRTYSTRIAEVEDTDKPDGREKPVGSDRGILWRLNSYWRVLEKDGGVYIQIESIPHSRGAPVVVDWLIGSFIRSAHRELHYHFVNATRAGLTGLIAGHALSFV